MTQFCRCSGHISISQFRALYQCVLQKILGNYKFDPICWVKFVPNIGILIDRGIIWSDLKVARIHMLVIFQAFLLVCSAENVPKPQIGSVPLSHKFAKLRKMNRPWPYDRQVLRRSGYICMPNLEHSVDALCINCPQTTKLIHFK